MTAALARLADYFGHIGIASIVAWMVAAALSALFILGWRRSKVCWAALVVAVAGLVLSRVNSAEVSAIKIDWSEQLQAARQRAASQTTEDEQPRQSDLSDKAQQAKQHEVAEKDPAAAGDADTSSGTTGSGTAADAQPPQEPDSTGEAAVEEEPRYAYRHRGKVERTEGMKIEEKILIGLGSEDRPVEQNVRMMKMDEVMEANRLDRLNLLFARWTLYLAVLLVVLDYFRRFNKTFESYLPLPVGGRLVDSLFSKSHTVCAHRSGSRKWKRFLRRTIRKGETFIYFGSKDPFAGKRLRRLPWFVPVPWSLEKVVCADGRETFDDEFLFESAWFGRYCFVLLGDGPRAVRRIDNLAAFLQLRRETRASAAHTVNVLWDLDTSIPPATLDRLLSLCRETNFKLILATPTRPGEELAARFEDVYA